MDSYSIRLVLLAAVLMALSACGDDADLDAGPDARVDATSDAGEDSALDSGRDAASDARDDSAVLDSGADMDADTSTDGDTPLACALPPAFDEGVDYENTVFVDASAEAGGDGSEAGPFNTLQRAFDAAMPGTLVRVLEGVYSPVFATNVQGTAAAPIRVRADAGAILDAMGDGEGIHLVDPRYLTLEGLTIQGTSSHAINIDDGGSYESPAQFVALRNITIEAAGSGGNNDCIKLSGVDDFWVQGSDIGGCDRGESIDMVGCHRGTILENTFRATVGNGVQAKGGCADTLITRNRFENIPGRAVNAGGSTGLEFFRPIDAPYEAAFIRVVSNVFVGVGAESGAPVAFVGCDGCEFVHNTIIEPETWIARILQETVGDRFVPTRNGVFANNLIVLNPDALRTTVNVGSNTSPETFSFLNNLWFAFDRRTWGGPTYPASISERDAIIQEDPLLSDRAGGDYSLMVGSPAIAAGADVGPLPPGFDGRCFADPPAAIGAFAAPE